MQSALKPDWVQVIGPPPLKVRAEGTPAREAYWLQHLKATTWTRVFTHLKLVRGIAGHSTVTTTMRYAKIFTGDAHDILNATFGF